MSVPTYVTYYNSIFMLVTKQYYSHVSKFQYLFLHNILIFPNKWLLKITHVKTFVYVTFVWWWDEHASNLKKKCMMYLTRI